jgi:hypothetical protein
LKLSPDFIFSSCHPVKKLPLLSVLRASAVKKSEKITCVYTSQSIRSYPVAGKRLPIKTPEVGKLSESEKMATP